MPNLSQEPVDELINISNKENDNFSPVHPSVIENRQIRAGNIWHLFSISLALNKPAFLYLKSFCE